MKIQGLLGGLVPRHLYRLLISRNRPGFLGVEAVREGEMGMPGRLARGNVFGGEYIRTDKRGS